MKRSAPKSAALQAIREVARETGSTGGTVDAVPTKSSDRPVTDDELAALALAYDPDTVVPDDAVSLWDLTEQDLGPLPAWYMPPVTAGLRSHQLWRRRVAILIICAFIVIDAYGLCSTFGSLVVA